MTDTQMKWRERVAAWRASGETAEAFAAEGEFEATTLRYWASRLKSRKADSAPAQAPKPVVAMARVVRRRGGPGLPRTTGNALGGIVVVVGDARIAIGRDFDPVLLREVVAALGGGE